MTEPPPRPDAALAATLDAVDVALACTDAQGRLRAANAALKRWAPEPLPEHLATLLGLPVPALLDAAQRARAGEAPAPLTLPSAGGRPALRASVRRLGDGDELLWTLQELPAEATALAERLALLREFGRLAMWERDVATRQGWWDRDMFRLFGMDEAGGTPDFAAATQAIVPEDREAVRRTFGDSLAKPGRYEHHYRVCTPDGVRRLHSQWRVIAGPDGRPQRVLGVATDDTEVWRLAQAAHAMQAQLGLAIELTGLLVWRHDLRTDTIVHLMGSEVLPSRSGSGGQFTKAELDSHVHPDDLPALDATRERALHSDGPLDVTFRVRASGGEWRHLLTRRVAQRDDEGRPLALLGVSFDRTREVLAAEELQRAHERAALVARAVGIGTWEQDAATGQARWDEAMWALRGLPPGDAPLGAEERLALVHPDDQAMVRQVYDGSRAGEPLALEFRLRRGDTGEWRWLASRSMPVFDADGRLLRRVGVNWDITEARAVARAREERQLAQRESEAKSRFLARMSHELRTPLNAVLGFAQLLEGDDALDAGARRQAAQILAAGRQLLALVDGVLELSSLESGALPLREEQPALAPLWAALAARVAPQVQARGLTLQADAPPALAVRADAARLQLALSLLLDHALQASPPGSRVLMQARAEGDEVLMSIDDGGPALSDAQRRAAFDPFQPADASQMGLAIVRATMQRMGGRAEALPLPVHGTRWQLVLPRAEPRAAAPAAGNAVHRLLYIEDNPVNALIVRELVARRADLLLDVAETGLAGVQRALQEPPALLLLDMQLPDIDGLEVLRRLRADPRTARLPCIALSANAMAEDIRAALEAGFDDYWTKPLDFRQFMAALDARFGPAPP